jgi:CheY-like chemotaxis protein
VTTLAEYPRFLTKPRILVVDDEPLIALLMEDWLTELGCEVVGPAHSVRQALELVPQGKLDGAFLDVGLPGEDVYTLASELDNHGVPFSFLTGRDRLAVRTKRPDLIMQKPIDFAALKTVLEKWCLK